MRTSESEVCALEVRASTQINQTQSTVKVQRGGRRRQGEKTLNGNDRKDDGCFCASCKRGELKEFTFQENRMLPSFSMFRMQASTAPEYSADTTNTHT